MGALELVLGRNIDHIHLSTRAQFLGAVVRLAVKLAAEFLQLAWVDIGGGSECDVRVLHESRNHVAGTATQPNDPHAQGRRSLAITSNSGHGSSPYISSVLRTAIGPAILAGPLGRCTPRAPHLVHRSL